MSIKQSISLYFTEGSSDKVYQASIVEVAGGYMVEFQYGRRGSTLKSGTKTDVPVPYAEAEKIYRKLVAEKTGKGYTESATGSVYAGTDRAGRFVGHKPQLLNATDEFGLEEMLSSDDWMMQEKYDGERQFLIRRQGRVFGANRDGLEVAIPQVRIDEMHRLECTFDGDFVLDGESIGDRFYVFDCLIVDGEDVTRHSAEIRVGIVEDVLNRTIGRGTLIDVVDTYYDTESKRAAFARLQAENAEGVVFKRRRGVYTPDRPASGGDQLKFKFYDELTVQVGEQNLGKRSVQISMRDGADIVDVGNVTIPENAAIPAKGQFIDVRYLYANKGGSLFQPVYMKLRSDKHEADDVSQIKIKRDHEAHVSRGPRP